MGTTAKYTMDIKDITYVSDDVQMTVTLDRYVAYSYQSPTSVQNELLSEVTTPGYFSATVSQTHFGSGETLYLPYFGDAFLKSATCTEGFQYAIAYMHTNIMNHSLASPATITATCQYSYNGNDWYDASYQSIARVSDNFGATEDVFDQLYASFVIPGSVSPVALWTRWKVYNEAGGGDVWFYNYTISMDVIPRHTHVWQQVGQSPSTMQAQQVDDASYSGSTPESITCTINGTPINITCAAPSYANNLNIKGYLVTGVNTIDFTSTTPCRVTPSANYTALPT